MSLGKFSVYPADRNLPLLPGAPPLQPKKLWLIVKELRTGNHQLQELDVIKLGRFKLRVKQLVKSGTTPPVRDAHTIRENDFIYGLSPSIMANRVCE